MTSLVAVMNNKAAAVAADSAMTVTDGVGNTRVRMGVQKLFQLSDIHPISVMIYNSAEIMNMAWGPIMVQYRKQFGRTEFAAVGDCAEHFMSFLDSYSDLFHEQAQEEAYIHYVNVLFDWVRENVNAIVEAENEDPSEDGPRTMRDVMRLATERVYDDVMQDTDDEDRPDLPGFDAAFAKDLNRRYAADVQGIIDEMFGEAEPDKDTQRKLREIAIQGVTKDFFPDFFPNTGLVFTGYGDRQITPQMVAYLVGFAVGGKLRRRRSSAKTINSQDPVIIAPFAQDKMIHTFLTGMDAELQDYLADQIIDLAVAVRDKTIAQLPQLSRKQRKDFAERYSDDDVVAVINGFLDRLDGYQYDIHTHPILLAVESLPETDLAHTAEMLVGLNAFQQQVSTTLESVGGDIDVALLTNESFRWVRNARMATEGLAAAKGGLDG